MEPGEVVALDIGCKTVSGGRTRRGRGKNEEGKGGRIEKESKKQR